MSTSVRPAPPPEHTIHTRRVRRWWFILATVVVASFAVLLWMGTSIAKSKPPVPDQVVDASGTVVMTGKDIMDGQRVWQSIGGQQVGSVWGHGAYVAPDWTADWLHREAISLLDDYAKAEGARSFDDLDPEQ